MIHVTNKRAARAAGQTSSNTVYIGRPSPLGNPYSHLNGTLADMKTGTRDEAVELYAAWLQRKLLEKDAAVCGELNRLYTLARVGDVYLECWCAPRRCHGDVVKAVLEETLKKRTPR
jgi:Domain of unknown function (DUF4326)